MTYATMMSSARCAKHMRKRWVVGEQVLTVMGKIDDAPSTASPTESSPLVNRRTHCAGPFLQQQKKEKSGKGLALWPLGQLVGHCLISTNSAVRLNQTSRDLDEPLQT
jgi:hypothetical protein